MVKFIHGGNSITGLDILKGSESIKSFRLKSTDESKNDDLEKLLDAIKDIFQDGCKQLSQLIAWMWLDENIAEIEDNEQVELLKKLFDAILKYQAFNNNELGCNAIAAILKGENQAAYEELQKDPNIKFSDIIDKVPSLKLGDVYGKLVPQNGEKNEYKFKGNYLDNFYTVVTTDDFNGSLSFDFFGTKNPTRKPKFIVVIPYPAKPALSNFTVSEEELKTWAKDEDKYLPPNWNPFIPINGSC